MDIAYRLKRLQDVLHAVRIARTLAAHERWTRDELCRYQRSRFLALLRHAVDRSPFYRELYRSIGRTAAPLLADLPVIDKRTVMDNFDRLVTDRRLTLAALQDHLRTVRHDPYYLGQYRVLATTGTSGLRGGARSSPTPCAGSG